MRRNKFLCTLAISSVLALGAVAGITGAKALGVAGDPEDCAWNHYAAVDATLDVNGCKEYWVCCAHHEVVLTAPTSGTVTDVAHGDTAAFLATLEAGDSRYVAAYGRHQEFEDGVHYLSAATNVTSIVSNETEGVEGSKCVQVNITNSDYFIGIDQGYLDAVFADANVTALSFEAKASTATNNFRNGAGVTFETNATGYGIDTGYKTFYYTKAMYTARSAGENFIKGGGLAAGSTVYLDNFRVLTSATKPTNVVSFETGAITHDGNNHTIRESLSSSDSKQIGLVSGAGAKVVEFTNGMHSSGSRSLHIEKQSGYLAIYASAAFYNSLPEEGMLFDLYTSIDIALYGNDNAKFQWLNNWGNPKGGWVTYHLTKAQVGTDGRFLILQGSPAGDVYIDNIRAADVAMGFENSHATYESAYAYATGHQMPTVSNLGTLTRDTYRNYQFFANGAVITETSIDDKHVSEGNFSFKVSVSGKGYCALFMSIPFIKANWEKGIKMDVYSEGVTFTGGSSMAGVTSGKWTTITLSKSNFETTTIGGVSDMPNGRFFVNNANTAGSFWIDNIRVA